MLRCTIDSHIQMCFSYSSIPKNLEYPSSNVKEYSIYQYIQNRMVYVLLIRYNTVLFRSNQNFLKIHFGHIPINFLQCIRVANPRFVLIPRYFFNSNFQIFTGTEGMLRITHG